jgi:hypothetical protein
MIILKKAAAVFAAIAATCVLQSSAHAGMVLTPAGITEGFTLSTFVNAVPSNGAVGPVGIGFPGGGNVMVSGYANGQMRVFSDTDGQAFSAGALGSTYGGNDAAGLTNIGSTMYLARQAANRVDIVSSAGVQLSTLSPVIVFATGMAGNSTNGHFYVSRPGVASIMEIDPAAGGSVVTTFGNSSDGLTLSSDHKTLYATDFSTSPAHIVGWDTTSYLKVFDSGAVPGGPDGVAIGSGVLAGKLYVNTNDGRVIEINTGTLAQVVIAAGGSRGDLVNVDPYNDTVLLTQTDSVLRLAGPPGGGFGTTPVPAAVWTGLAMLACLPAYSFLRRARAGR